MLGETFAIHAGFAEPDPRDVAAAVETARRAGSAAAAPRELPRGCVVGLARLEGWVESDDGAAISACSLHGGDERAARARATEALRSPWFTGRVAFFLAEVVALPEPIAIRGALGFWPVPPEVEREIARQRG
jgi:hypothetical protein